MEWMRRWIGGLLIAALVLGAGFGWEFWMPRAAGLALGQLQALPLKRVGVFLLKNTDPSMKQIGRYLTDEFFESPDEPFLYFTKEEQKPETPQEELPAEIKGANLSALSGTYTQYNGTAVANGTDFDVRELVTQTVEMPQFEEGKPAILIYHTHTTECYRNDAGQTNTTDESRNVVAVGEAMKAVFEQAGYQTIHIKEVFNQKNFKQSYSYSRAAVEKVLAENPSIQVVLDVHRDSIVSNGVEYYPVTEVDGKEAAQVMIVCGTDAKGLEHPEWRRNFVYGLELSRRMGQLYPDLSRPVNLRTDRFNTHFTPYTLLMEMGSSANTLEQAVYGAELTAAAMIDLWNTS